MVLCIGHRILRHGLHVRGQLLHGREFGAVDHGVRRHEACHVWRTEVDGDGPGLQRVEELLGDVAVDLVVLDGEDELVVRHGAVEVLPPVLLFHRRHSALRVQGEGGVAAAHVVDAAPEGVVRDVGEELLGQLVSEFEAPRQRDAELVSKALRKIDDRHIYTIIEIACASSPEHLIAVRKAYLSLFSSSIEEDVASKFSAADPLRQLLVLLVSSYRYDGEQVDEVMAKFEAVELRDAIKKNQPHRDEVIRILGTRSKPQLKATFNYYEQNSRDIGQDIKKTSKGQFSSILRAAVWCIGSPEKHFAEVLRSSIEGLGTDESTLNRVIISRAEIDMVKIKDEYKSKYKTTLKADVKGDTSGDYKSFLLALVGDSNT